MKWGHKNFTLYRKENFKMSRTVRYQDKLVYVTKIWKCPCLNLTPKSLQIISENVLPKAYLLNLNFSLLKKTFKIPMSKPCHSYINFNPKPLVKIGHFTQIMKCKLLQSVNLVMLQTWTQWGTKAGQKVHVIETGMTGNIILFYPTHNN